MTAHRSLVSQAKAVVLFDGVCNLCDASVRFIAKRDPKAYFHFAALQSPLGQRLLAEHGLLSGQVDSVILVDGKRAYQRSDAALRIVSKLRGAWPALSAFRIVPRVLRDRVYDWIASHRYGWFGRKEECMTPAPEVRDRFIED